jgi:hypothetical protein
MRGQDVDLVPQVWRTPHKNISGQRFLRELEHRRLNPSVHLVGNNLEFSQIRGTERSRNRHIRRIPSGRHKNASDPGRIVPRVERPPAIL